MKLYRRAARVWAGAVIAGLAAAEGPAHAETFTYFEPHTGRHELVDSENPGRFATPSAVHARVRNRARGGSLTWNVAYQDVIDANGTGFDDPAQGATRRATLESVLSYVDSILNETTGAAVDILMDTSQTAGDGFLASAGTFMPGGTGYSSGFAHEHITSGVDPSVSLVDIYSVVDFGYSWNSDTGNPGPAEYDLFTVLLHEVTHGLGFLNGASVSGPSIYSGTSSPGRYGVLAQFTEFDDSGPLSTGTTTPLWVGAGSFTGMSSDLISGRLVFNGANTVAVFGGHPTIYSGATFLSGSSLSHWGDNLGGQAVMPRFVSSGSTMRQYPAFEVGALQDLGYAYASASPPPPSDQDQDSLDDSVETNTGTFVDSSNTGTNPADADSDDDGVLDGIEVSLGTNPNNPLDFPALPLAALPLLILVVAGVGVLLGIRSLAASTR